MCVIWADEKWISHSSSQEKQNEQCNLSLTIFPGTKNPLKTLDSIPGLFCIFYPDCLRIISRSESELSNRRLRGETLGSFEPLHQSFRWSQIWWELGLLRGIIYRDKLMELLCAAVRICCEVAGSNCSHCVLVTGASECRKERVR